MSNKLDSDPNDGARPLFKIGSTVSFLYFKRDHKGEILDVWRLEGTIMDIHVDLPDPYVVGMYKDDGTYWETYAGTEHTRLIANKLPPLENGPKKGRYITYDESDFRP